MGSPILVTCRLISPLAGPDAPQLDSLLEAAATRLRGKPDDLSGYKIHRGIDPADLPVTPIPIPRERLGGWLVARCSAPIYRAAFDSHEHVCRRVDPANIDAYDRGSLGKINTSGGDHKSWRLPMRVRDVGCVRWFAVGEPSRVLEAMEGVTSIGKKGSIGYGRVASWTVEPVSEDYSWYMPDHEGRPVLMRVLPAGPWLPRDLQGARPDYAAACPPYWHPGLRTEVVTPC